MTRLSEDEIKAIDEEQKHVRSQWGDNRTLKNCRALLADREAILAELEVAQTAIKKLVTSAISDHQQITAANRQRDDLQAELAAAQEASAYLAGCVNNLKAELDRYKRATQFCEDCLPNNSTVPCCQRCALLSASASISAIDYICGEPNAMQVSDYDADYNDERVVARVSAMKAELAAVKAELAEFTAPKVSGPYP